MASPVAFRAASGGLSGGPSGTVTWPRQMATASIGRNSYNRSRNVSRSFATRSIQIGYVESFPTRGIRNKGIARYEHAAFDSSSFGDRGNPIGISSSTSALPEETRGT
mgnify:CR=1 FL=1